MSTPIHPRHGARPTEQKRQLPGLQIPTPSPRKAPVAMAPVLRKICPPSAPRTSQRQQSGCSTSTSRSRASSRKRTTAKQPTASAKDYKQAHIITRASAHALARPRAKHTTPTSNVGTRRHNDGNSPKPCGNPAQRHGRRAAPRPCWVSAEFWGPAVHNHDRRRRWCLGTGGGGPPDTRSPTLPAARTAPCADTSDATEPAAISP